MEATKAPLTQTEVNNDLRRPNDSDAQRMKEFLRGVCQTFPDIAIAINRACEDASNGYENILWYQARLLSRYTVEDAKEVVQGWVDGTLEDRAVLRSPQVGLNIRAAIDKKRSQALKEEQQSQQRAEYKSASGAYAAMAEDPGLSEAYNRGMELMRRHKAEKGSEFDVRADVDYQAELWTMLDEVVQ